MGIGEEYFLITPTWRNPPSELIVTTKRDAIFQKLAREWHEETKFISSLSDVAEHPAYLKIVAMGREAIPLIMRELRRRRGHWIVALEEITGVNPVDPADYGYMDRMTDTWLNWGTENGFC